MVFPIIAVIAIFAITAGGGTLAWYARLSKAQRERYDAAFLQWLKTRGYEIASRAAAEELAKRHPELVEKFRATLPKP